MLAQHAVVMREEEQWRGAQRLGDGSSGRLRRDKLFVTSVPEFLLVDVIRPSLMIGWRKARR